MGTSSSITSVAHIYKRKYYDEAIENQTMRNHPWLAMIRKKPGFTGVTGHYYLNSGNPQGVSSTFASAQAYYTGSSGEQLSVSRKSKFGIVRLDAESIDACADKGAFVDLVTGETDGIIAEVSDALAFDLYRQYGNRGRRLSISSNTVTLTNQNDVRNFKKNMQVVADDTLAGTSLRTGTTYVTALNYSGSTITLADASQISSFSNSDYLYRHGDPTKTMEGMAALFPLTAPIGGDSFRGIDRSTDVERYAGNRIDDTGTPLEENIGLAAVTISNVLNKRDVIGLCNPINVWKMARRLNAKVQYQDAGGTVKYGFQFVEISTPGGDVRVISDPDCPTDLTYVGDQSTMSLWHLRGLPHMGIDDGGRFELRVSDADAVEGRVRGRCNLVCTAPASWCVINT